MRDAHTVTDAGSVGPQTVDGVALQRIDDPPDLEARAARYRLTGANG